MARTLIWNASKEAKPLLGYGLDANELVAGRGLVVDAEFAAVLADPAVLAGGFTVIPVLDSVTPSVVFSAAEFGGGSGSSGFAQWGNVLEKPEFAETDAIKALGAATAAGTGFTIARGDHVHTHGTQGGGDQHVAATAQAAGFMSAADKDRLDKIRPATVANQAAGGLPSALGTAAWGTSTDYAAADHVHAHGDLGGTGLQHSLAAAPSGTQPGVDGFLSSADKVRIDKYLGRYDVMITKKGPFYADDTVAEFFLPRKIKVLGVLGGDVRLQVKATPTSSATPVSTNDTVLAGVTLQLIALTDLPKFVGALQAVEVE